MEKFLIIVDAKNALSSCDVRIQFLITVIDECRDNRDGGMINNNKEGFKSKNKRFVNNYAGKF